ncbi:hypothetical protein TRVL_01194 [Trypanosoma vivax]|nr:hypothetical protein TRVL_01194 [Trypanosoma vivax]
MSSTCASEAAASVLLHRDFAGPVTLLVAIRKRGRYRRDKVDTIRCNVMICTNTTALGNNLELQTPRTCNGRYVRLMDRSTSKPMQPPLLAPEAVTPAQLHKEEIGRKGVIGD